MFKPVLRINTSKKTEKCDSRVQNQFPNLNNHCMCDLMKSIMNISSLPISVPNFQQVNS